MTIAERYNRQRGSSGRYLSKYSAAAAATNSEYDNYIIAKDERRNRVVLTADGYKIMTRDLQEKEEKEFLESIIKGLGAKLGKEPINLIFNLLFK